MSTRQPVVAVIPHYNMLDTLVPLIRQVLQQKYDAVYVLDDKSTNGDVQERTKPFGTSVTLILGKSNRGPGGNRNRILQIPSGKVKGSILHFIDADCELLSKSMPDAARQVFADTSVGAVAGLILNPDNSYFEYNYFPDLSLRGGLAGAIIMATHAHVRLNRWVYRSLPRLLAGYPNPYEPPVARDVSGIAEANMLIPYDTLSEIGGFDEALRFGEAQDIAYKLAARRLSRRFDPSIIVKHHSVQLPDKKRARAMLQANYRLVRKYGLRLT